MRSLLKVAVLASLDALYTVFVMLPTENMCDHILLVYGCGDKIYLVKAWCFKYQDTRIPCGANPIDVWVYILLLWK